MAINNVKIKTVIQHRRGMAAEWNVADPVLATAELGYETDTGRWKIGDGTTAWNGLPYREELPQADTGQLGGVKASPRQQSDTVEVRIDTSTGKLYVKPGITATGILPELQVKAVPRQQSGSRLFHNEPERITNADLFIRPMCDIEYFHRIKSEMYVALARCNSRHSRRYVTQDADRISARRKGWHVVEETFLENASLRYPNKTSFPLNQKLSPFWTPLPLCAIKMTDLFADDYGGQWVTLPYDLESIVRRFVYVYKTNVTEGTLSILPVSAITQDNPGAILKIPGTSNRLFLSGSRTSASDYYASVNLGICLCYKTGTPNMQAWNMGPVTPFRVFFLHDSYNNTNKYLIRLGNGRRKVKL